MRTLITGGAGFIGSNTADRLLGQGEEVILLDNLSRPGSAINLEWLRKKHGEFPFIMADVRDYPAVKHALADHQPLDAVLHFAAQVAVTTSVDRPREDFEVNALGTLNVLEAVRELQSSAAVLYTSTNKVYGALEGVGVVEEGSRYTFKNLPRGVPETMPLDFYSPYGCSKGAADQYARDYHRIYGVRSIVFRNSCIYGPRQFGIEDQGWLAWFVIAAVTGRPITIYGDGRQVRDVLHVSDLIDVMLLAVQRIDEVKGQVFNLGGGPQNSIAVWSELRPMLESMVGHELPVGYQPWRPGDQKVYVSDISKASRELGWAPKIDVADGLRSLLEWVMENRSLFA